MPNRLVLGLVSLWLLPACSGEDDASSFDFGEPISRVIVDVDRGDIHITGDAAQASSVDVHASWRSAREPDVDVWASDGTLHINGDCPEVAICRTDVYIDVPAAAELEIDLRTGDIEIERVHGNVIAEITTGTIEAYDMHAGIVDAKTVTGRIDLRFAAGATDVTARTTTGNVALTVPNRAYDVDAEVTTGDVDVRVDTSSSATARLFAKVITGDVTVRPN